MELSRLLSQISISDGSGVVEGRAQKSSQRLEDVFEQSQFQYSLLSGLVKSSKLTTCLSAPALAAMSKNGTFTDLQDVEEPKRSLSRDIEYMKIHELSKFVSLCKLHLTFVLDLDSDKLEEVSGSLLSLDGSQVSASSKGLPRLFKRKRRGSDTDLTFKKDIEGGDFILHLIEYLSKEENIKHEGLFRKAGHVGRQKELREAMAAGEDCLSVLEQGKVNVHDSAALLKTLLGQLPEPLLGASLYKTHCLVAEMSHLDKQLKALQILMLLLPDRRRAIVRHLILLLFKVTQHSENKMSAEALGMIFAPHILCPRKMTGSELHAVSGRVQMAVAAMITRAKDIFKVPTELALDIMNHCKEREAQANSTCSLDSSHPKRTKKRSLFGGLSQDSLSKTPGGKSESQSDGEIINTVVSYATKVDTGAGLKNGMDDTKVALAQLYAHVQAMPDSARKHKLLKQFNEANGQGSPKVAKPRQRSKSLSESIKNRFMRTRQKSAQSLTPSGIKKNAMRLAIFNPQYSDTTPAKSENAEPDSSEAAAKGSEDCGADKPKVHSALDTVEITPLQRSPYLRHKLGLGRRPGLQHPSGEGKGDKSKEGAAKEVVDGPPRLPVIKPALLPQNAYCSPLVRRNRPVKERKAGEPVLLKCRPASQPMSIMDGSEEML